LDVSVGYAPPVPHLTYSYRSEALQKNVQAEIVHPDASVPGPFHVMFLLHGLSDDQSIWMRRTSIERYLDGVPLIVVMPDGGRGWYTDAREGYAYETALAVELPTFIEKMFNTALPWAVSGLSMGGFGALKFALKYPERFASAVSHSGALGMGHWPPSRDDAFDSEVRRVFGADSSGGPDDLFALASSLGDRAPSLHFDCGKEDFLLDSNRAFAAHLSELGMGHEYMEFPGGHDWGYWDEHVREGIAFHRRSLGI
jgi:putative tributyrin esterase